MVRRMVLAGLVAASVTGFGLAARAQAGSGAMGGMDMSKPAAQPSTRLVLLVDGIATTFSVADLKAMPQRAEVVHNEPTKVDEKYVGVALGYLLAKAGFVADKTTHRKRLHSLLRAVGTDTYSVLYPTTEIEDLLVATSMDGKDLGADGNFKLVSAEDKKPWRRVSNLALITVDNAK